MKILKGLSIGDFGAATGGYAALFLCKSNQGSLNIHVIIIVDQGLNFGWRSLPDVNFYKKPSPSNRSPNPPNILPSPLPLPK